VGSIARQIAPVKHYFAIGAKKNAAPRAVCYNGCMATLLGRKLRAARIEAGVETLEDIAPLVGRKPRQCQSYESGATVPPADVLQRWAAATGKPISYFLPDDAPSPPSPPVAPDHPGVRALCTEPDQLTIRQHHMTDEEVEDLAGLVVLRRGKPVSIRTRGEAVAWCHALRSSPPPE